MYKRIKISLSFKTIKHRYYYLFSISLYISVAEAFVQKRLEVYTVLAKCTNR